MLLEIACDASLITIITYLKYYCSGYHFLYYTLYVHVYARV